MHRNLRLMRRRTQAKLYFERNTSICSSRGQFAPAITHLSSISDLSTRSSPSHIFLPHSSSSFFASFSTTSYHYKKGAPKGKKSVSTSNTEHIPDNKAQTNRDREIDPYDFSDLEAKIKHQADWLRESLQKLRTGGRLSAETIEGLHVEIKHGLGGEGGQGKKMEKLRLGDLATVVPRGGRLMGVMVNEEAVRLSHFIGLLPLAILWLLCCVLTIPDYLARQTHNHIHSILGLLPDSTT